MKGIIIVAQRDLEQCPGLEQSLLKFSESTEKEGDNAIFFSGEGVLMTMICELLDREVKYTLKFDAASQPVEGRVTSGTRTVKG